MIDELVKSSPTLLPVLVSGLVGGFMGLAGVYLASILNRGTQYGLWHLPKRAEQYERFWLSYKSCFDAILKYRESDQFHRDELSEREKKIALMYDPFSKQLKITRLYASDAVKTRIQKLESAFGEWCFMKASSASTTPSGSVSEAIRDATRDATELMKLFNLEHELQQVFERDLRKV